ncbi:GTPase IMAP family member 7-like [Poecilia reticulata]|uniref:GTPase IMAP family member 7-like n=1 Tax=Poecilia reticulata TaxID=8081 RepID=UPI0004A3EF08|nr:PREDICTED: GTPase IMAP family member 7-like [Poecilia reticulata]
MLLEEQSTKINVFPCLLVRLRRIAIIGQTGAGRSSLGNTIFKEQKFKVNHDGDPGMRGCEAKTKRVGGREITLIDMPGLFDPETDEKQLKAELLKGITECSPGPHAFLIVLNVEKSTEKDNDIVSKMNEHFSEEVFKYSTVVFTHGDWLPRRQQIQGLVRENKFLSDLVEKCGNRCHVVDNKRWNKRSKYGYRSNRYQVKKLLKSIEKTVEENDGSFNAMLQKIEETIKKEEERIAKSSRNIPEEKIRETAKGKCSG